MELLLRREPSTDGATIGQLFINGTFFCWTLEDVTRAQGVKIYGETAIPFGRYKVIVNMSRRFGRPLPLVLGVENFTGVRIHGGNNAKDTEGCILVGLARAKDAPQILSSQAALRMLIERMQHALKSEEIWITIEPAPAESVKYA